jgi:hypothetical protein
MQQALAGSVGPARRAAAALLLELVQQTPELAEACASGGGCASLVELLRLERQSAGWARGLLAAGGWQRGCRSLVPGVCCISAVAGMCAACVQHAIKDM